MNFSFRKFTILLLIVFIVGAIPRLYMLSSQILLDDEWHGIIAVLEKDLLSLIIGFNPNDNSSPPLNLFNYFVIHWFGLSELGVRLPSVLSGLLSLVILPLALRKILSSRVAAIFAILLSISPFLIFYSRFSRAYSLMMLLCFLCLAQSYHWLTTGNRTNAGWYILLGSLAVYVHPFALCVVVVPPVFALGAHLVKLLGPRDILGQYPPTSKDFLIVAVFTGSLVLAMLLPMIRNSSQLPWAKGNITGEGFLRALSLQSGTANLPSNFLFYLLAAHGIFFLIRNKPVLGWLMSGTVCSYLVILFGSRPLGIGNGAILLRYMIVLVPFSLASVAVAIDDIMSRLPNGDGSDTRPLLGAVCFACLLFFAGPLSGIYDAPNNFTNHSAFQASYQNIDWAQANAHNLNPNFPMSRDRISPFYTWLASQDDVRAIIEYPFDICNYNNLLYYCQHCHQKRVIAGYCSNNDILGYSYDSRLSVGMLNIDTILSGLEGEKLNTRNLIDVADPISLSRGGADIIVLHKYLMALCTSPSLDGKSPVKVEYRSVPFLKASYQTTFGQAIYEDEQLICFFVKSAGK